MKPTKGIKRYIESILQYCFAFIVVLYGQCLWMRIELFPGFVENRNTILAVSASIILVLLILNQGKIRKRILLISVIPIMVFCFHYILLQRGTNTIFISVLPPMVLLILYLGSLWEKPKGIEKFIIKYTDIVFVLAFLSVVMYIFGSILGVLNGHDVTYYWADAYLTRKTYYHFMYEAQTFDLFGVRVPRNCGVFPEAPSYAVPLVLSLFFEEFILEKHRKSRIIVYMSAIITSFSTKAILMVVIMVILKIFQYAYINRDKSKTKFRMIIKLMMPIISIILLYVGIALIEQREDSISYVQRMDNIQSTLLAFRRNWLIGVGVGNEAAVSAFSHIYMARYGYSIGATLLLAEGGIYLASFYFYSFIHALCHSDNRWRTIIVFVVYFGLLLMSNIPFFLSTTFLVALAYSRPVRRTGLYKSNLAT